MHSLFIQCEFMRNQTGQCQNLKVFCSKY